MTQTTLIFLILVIALAILADATTVVEETTKFTLTNNTTSNTIFNRKYGETASPSSYPEFKGEGTVDPTAQQNAWNTVAGGVISPLDDESTGALASNVNVDTNVLLQKNVFFWGAKKTFQPVVGLNSTVFAANKDSCGSKIETSPGTGMKHVPKQDMKQVSVQTGTTSQNCVVSCPRDNKLVKTKPENGTSQRGPILDCGGSGDTATFTDGAIDDSKKTFQDENVWKRRLRDSKLDQPNFDLDLGPRLGLVKALRKNEEGKLSMEKVVIETTMTTKTVSKVTYHQKSCSVLEYDKRDILWYVPFFFFSFFQDVKHTFNI